MRSAEARYFQQKTRFGYDANRGINSDAARQQCTKLTFKRQTEQWRCEWLECWVNRHSVSWFILSFLSALRQTGIAHHICFAFNFQYRRKKIQFEPVCVAFIFLIFILNLWFFNTLTTEDDSFAEIQNATFCFRNVKPNPKDLKRSNEKNILIEFECLWFFVCSEWLTNTFLNLIFVYFFLFSFTFQTSSYMLKS